MKAITLDKKVLVAVSLYGTLKNYILDQFLKMAKSCIDPVENVDIIVFGDRGIGGYEFIPCEIKGNGWADDVIWSTHQKALDTARDRSYDAVLFQGIDCLYNSEADFRRLVGSNEDIVGAITMGRKAPEYAVVRDWIEKEIYDGYSHNSVLTTKQTDVNIPKHSNGLVPCGFPGTEAMLINRKECFDIPIANPKYEMWYADDNDRDTYLCVHEFWCYQAAKLGYKLYVDTSVKTWHCDDSGYAHRWQVKSVKNEDLVWSL